MLTERAFFMPVFFVALLVALFCTSKNAAAQSTMSEREAMAKIEQWARQQCIPIPIGTHKTLPVPMWNHEERTLARSAIAFEKAGVVSIKSVGSLVENILTVELNPDFDKTNLYPDAGFPCLIESADLKITKLVKIDASQGGTSLKWNASVVYALYTYSPNPIAVRYHMAMGTAGDYGERKGIFLFKQDPFNQMWTLVALDTADVGASTFDPTNVAQRLRGN